MASNGLELGRRPGLEAVLPLAGPRAIIPPIITARFLSGTLAYNYDIRFEKISLLTRGCGRGREFRSGQRGGEAGPPGLMTAEIAGRAQTI